MDRRGPMLQSFIKTFARVGKLDIKSFITGERSAEVDKLETCV